MRTARRLPVHTLCALVAVASLAHAEHWIRGHDPDRHNRFNGSPLFLLAGHDFSGVGTATGRWVTMISPSFFLTVDHAPAQGEVRFIVGNDIHENRRDLDVAWTQKVGNADLRVGKLTTPLPADVTFFPILDLASESAYVGSNVYTYGKHGSEGRVGRNTVESFSWNPNTWNTRRMHLPYDRVGGLGADESYVQTGDSGGPTFALVDGQLALVGLHIQNSGNYDGSEPPHGAVSRDTFVPHYLDEIAAILAPYGEGPTVVGPGAASIRLLGCGLNPPGSLIVQAGTPRIATTMFLGLDNPLGTQGPGTQPLLFLSTHPDPSPPCGTPVPGWGMHGPGATGRLLIDVATTAPPLVFVAYPWNAPGQPRGVQIDVPDRASLVGRSFYVQGVMVDASALFGVPIALTRGMELTIGL